ncbi:hypothetical protein [Micromonospora sp. DT47]|uniref:hypothetical protein n=1 Tax=Micromonospora sp. DT47 TaxID=3393431 RepID=UPI003CE7D513
MADVDGGRWARRTLLRRGVLVAGGVAVGAAEGAWLADRHRPIIAELRDRGYTFVTVSALLRRTAVARGGE